MDSVKDILYLTVSAYPYGNRETFLQPELEVLSRNFRQIFIVIPEALPVSMKTGPKRSIPDNVSLLQLKLKGGKKKLKGLQKLPPGAFAAELYFIRRHYRLRFSFRLLRLMLGFSSMAVSFAEQLERHICSSGFRPEQVTLYSYWFTYAATGIALMKQREPAYKAVTRVHGWDCFFDRSPDRYLPFRPWTISRLDLTTPVSEKGSNYLINLLGRKRFGRKIKTAYLGIGPFKRPANADTRSDKLHLVSIAFVDPVKRLECIANALLLLGGLTIHWTHIGGGPGLQQLREYTLSRIAGAINVSVTFTGDLVPEAVHKFLHERQPDALLCTSTSEGLPVSMMEAMAHAVPVISANVGGVAEIVRDYHNGMLLPENLTAGDLAKALLEFAAMPSMTRQQLRENAYDTYRSLFVAEDNFKVFCRDILK
jgi:glycosyltransferase involved in cell wall biosynthesis